MSRTRPIAGWLPALLLVPAAVVAGIAVTVPDDDLEAMREEQPLDLGTTWVYDVLDHGEPSGTRTSQVIGTASLIGSDGVPVPTAEVRRTYTDYPGIGPRTNVAYLAVDGDVMYQYAQEEDGRWYDIEPRIKAYAVPPKEGSSWSYEGKVGTIDFSSTNELTEIVDVEVGGRTFEGCAHFVNEVPLERDGDQENGPEATEVLDEWTCPGYGTVRSRDRVEEDGTDITEELTEFHGIVANWYAEGHEPEPAEAATTPPGWTEGFGLARTYAVSQGTLGRQPAWTDVRDQQALFAPASNGESMVLTEPNGSVSLRTTDVGEVRWRVQLRGPILAPPVVTGGTVLVADSLKRIWALSETDGRALWVHQLEDVVSATPTVVGDHVVVPTEDSDLTSFAVVDGDESWKIALSGGAVRTSPAYDGEHLLVGDLTGTLSAVEPDNGHVAWSASLDTGLAQGPLVVDGQVLVQDGESVVHAFGRDGSVRWQSRSRGQATAPMAAAHGVVVTSINDAELSGFDTRDGHRLWSRTLPPIRTAPAVVGDELVAVTREGEVQVLGLLDGKPLDQWTLPRPAAGDRDVSVYASPALVGDTLVISGHVDGTIASDVMVAYPVRPETEPGASLNLSARDVPGTPTEPPVLVGDDLVVATSDGLYRVGPDGAATRLMSSGDAVQTGAAVADGFVVARHGATVQGRRLADGKLIWESPGGDAAFGAIAAVADGSVYYGIADQGLVAVDLHTGKPRWVRQIKNTHGVFSPLVLPDGDVLYGGGGLARYDGATGEPAWQDTDAALFSAPAYADGVVYATSVSQARNAAFLIAADADTGRRLWSRPVADAQPFLSPVVGDGVVVGFDGYTARAYDTRTGEELWTLAMHWPPGGSPYVSHGRVFLTEIGNGHDVDDQWFRVSVHDLQTGRFLASWEPGATPFALRAVVGGTDDGRLLVPTSLQLVTVEAR
jgi:outer membrane protein assembly factor BamB